MATATLKLLATGKRRKAKPAKRRQYFAHRQPPESIRGWTVHCTCGILRTDVPGEYWLVDFDGVGDTATWTTSRHLAWVFFDHQTARRGLKTHPSVAKHARFAPFAWKTTEKAQVLAHRAPRA
jgi:hypothetical protein